MPYLGNTPSTSFATVVKDTFNGGSTGYTLSKVATTNSVSVFVENVRQEPTTAYAVSGTTLTFTATTPSGTGNIYVLHMNPTTTTTHPAAQNLTAVNGTLTGTLGVTGATTTAAITASGVVDITDATDASDATGDTGALRTEGGASIAKKLYVGTDLDVDGTANLDAVDIDGNVDIAGTSTLNDDVTFTGANYNVTWDKSNNKLQVADSGKITFGAGDDLQIYNDGSNSYVSDQGTGGLYLLGNVLRFGNQDNDEHYGGADDDGSVYFKHDNNTVFTTDTYGIIVYRTTTSAVLELAANTSSGSGSPQFIMKQGGTRYGFLEGGVNSAGNGYGNHLLIRAEQGDVYVRDSGGNSTQVSPHNFEYIPDGASETGAWCYKSDKFETEVIEKDGDDNPTKEKVKSGTFISADMTKVIRQVEKLTGEKLIHKGTLDVDENGEVSKHNDDGSKVTENIIAGLIKRIEVLESK